MKLNIFESHSKRSNGESVISLAIRDFLKNEDFFSSFIKKLRMFDSQIKEKEVKLFFDLFLLGVEYVFQKYGSIAGDIQIVNAIEYSSNIYDDIICYLGEDDTIYLTFKAIAKEIGRLRVDIYRTSPHLLKKRIMVSSIDFIKLIGVEEAHHSYYVKKTRQYNIGNDLHDYTGEVEQAATKEIFASMKYLNVTTLPIPDNFDVKISSHITH